MYKTKENNNFIMLPNLNGFNLLNNNLRALLLIVKKDFFQNDRLSK